MRKTGEKKLRGKGARFFAAAALSAALIGSQVPMSIAADSSAVVEMNELIPENITVDTVMELADVELPKNKYGKLKWRDSSIWLTERVQSCEVLLIPDEGVNLKEMKGWSEEDGGLICHIKVVVSSIEEGGWNEEEPEELVKEDETQEDTVTPAPGEDADSEKEPGNSVKADGETGADPDKENTENADENKNSETEEEKGDPEKKPDDTEAEGDSKKKPEDGSEAPKDSEENKGGSAEDTDKENGKEGDADSDHSEIETDGDTEADLEDDTNTGDNSNSENDDSESSDNTDGDDTPDNIFDNPPDFEDDGRPTDAPEGLTEEEKLLRAQMNHSAEGISVSGINLPWYVQFRVTSGESYEFTNETDATIFQSYEFELWDLQNHTEYEIPDGEYISVTVPVKEGYDYVIEHLLDNGAVETIIPSVDGSRLVFSTHSFSPFGIAGSKQLVGPDFPIDDVKPSVTPTPPATGKPGDNSGTGNSNGTTNSGGTGTSNSVNGTGDNGGQGNQAGSSSDNYGVGNSGGGNGGTGISDGKGGSSGTNGGNNAGNGTNGNSGNNNGINGNGNNSQSVNNGHAVQTGDTTMILPFVILVLAAGIVICVVMIIKKKK